MKHVLSIIAVFAMSGDSIAQEEFKPLFNGRDLTGWKAITEANPEGSSAFSANPEDKTIHTYADKEAGSKQSIECLYTEEEYSHFVLKLEYRWLEKRFAPRVDHDRDAGLLFHLHGELKSLWPNCVEMQLGESDAKKVDGRYATGDLWVIGKDVQVQNARNEKGFYLPGAESVLVGVDKPYDWSFIPEGNEKPHGQWNEVTLTVRGAEEAIFELNGKVVNRISKMTYLVDGKRVPLEKGPIGLQAEYAELAYRNIRIQELVPPQGEN